MWVPLSIVALATCLSTRDLGHSRTCVQYEYADEKHVDNAVGPIFKVWVYPHNVTAREGPLYYSRGSHRSSYSKLRWIHEMTAPPATEALREPALRMRADETDYGLEPSLPVLPIQGAERTLIVADTSGIHHRGRAASGVERHA